MIWSAPQAQVPVNATVSIPGSKSETNRALILAALSTGPSTISGGLDARDTQLMRAALRALGTGIDEDGSTWHVTPPLEFTGGVTLDCGLAGTVMRFVPPVAALAGGPVAFDGDEQAYGRPMQQVLGALAALGATVEGAAMALPFTLTGSPELAGGGVTIDASASSQFVSGLLLAGARFREGLDLRHEGRPIPSLPHVEMTVAMLRARGVEVDDGEPNRWVVRPGAIAPADISIEPDLSNAAPFLAAAAITGGHVTVPDWPRRTDQPGDLLRDYFQRFGADTFWHADQPHARTGALTVHGVDQLHAVDLDLHDASELTPVIAAMAALADRTSHIRGVGHIRGHETDRLAALAADLTRLGAHVTQTADGLVIHPRLLGGAVWRTYADHRMAHAGALLGLVVPDVELDDVTCTNKTMPTFVALWEQMLADSNDESDSDGESRADRRRATPGDPVR